MDTSVVALCSYSGGHSILLTHFGCGFASRGFSITSGGQPKAEIVVEALIHAYVVPWTNDDVRETGGTLLPLAS